MKKVLMTAMLALMGLFIGVGIAQAQASCTKVRCVLQTCTVYPYTENSYKTVVDNAWDSTLHNGRCPLDCFQWPCSQPTLATASNKTPEPCKPSPNDIGNLDHIVKNFGVVTIERVRRGDVDKYLRVFKNQKDYNSLAEFVAAINPQMMAWQNPVYSLSIIETHQLDAYFETHPPTTMEDLHYALMRFTNGKAVSGK